MIDNMSIDKWLSEKDLKEEKIKRERAFKRLTKEEVQELKKKKIRDIAKKEEQKNNQDSEDEKFLHKIIEFREWLNQRTYLKGDIEKIETWIKNLYLTIKFEIKQKPNSIDYEVKKKLIEKYKEIPPKFLDEKTRIALNKRIHGTTRTSSDNYYLRKLKNNISEKLKEAKYYEILDKLFEIL